MTPEQNRESVPLYSLGSLDDGAKRAVEVAASQDSSLQAEMAEWHEVAARIGLAAPVPEPTPELRAKLLRDVHGHKMGSRPLLQEEVSGIHVLRHGHGSWRPTPFAGVSSKLLFLDKVSGLGTSLLRFEPGAEYPSHHHSAEEQCYVIEGDIRLGELHLHQGDFTTATPGTTHGIITSDQGCVVLIIASIHDEIYD